MAPMTHILRSTKNLFVSTLLLLATLLATGPYLSVGPVDATSSVSSVMKPSAFAGPLVESVIHAYQDIDGSQTWRKTRYGWEDSSKWVQAETIRFERRIELVHPLSVSGIILLLSVGMLIWSSEEWDTERLFRSSKSIKRIG